MKKSLITLGLFLFWFQAQATSTPLSSNIALSHSGRFSISYHSEVHLFPATTEYFSNYAIPNHTDIALALGALSQDNDLHTYCNRPTFLKNAGLSDKVHYEEKDIQYSNDNCLITLDKSHAVFIFALKEPFENQVGDKIGFGVIYGNQKDIPWITSHINTHINPRDYYMNVLQTAQAASPFSDQIGWQSIYQQGIDFIGNAQDLCAARAAAARYLLPTMHAQDAHSFISQEGLGSETCPTTKITSNENPEEWAKIEAMPEVQKKALFDYIKDFHGVSRADGISYFYVPSIEGMDKKFIQQKIKQGRLLFEQTKPEQACGIIVDLRFNWGGNMYPMLLSLGGITPDDKLFSFGPDIPVYLSRDGNQLLHKDGTLIYAYDGHPVQLHRTKPMAVLTNFETSSSGIFTRIALTSGSQPVRVFGGTTSPTASVNETFLLADGATLNIMTDFIYRKDGSRVPLRVEPDVTVEEDYATLFDQDKDVTLQEATRWLHALPQCQER